MIYWACHCIRLDIDPLTLPYPLADTTLWTRIGKSHDKFKKDSEINAKATKPKLLTANTNWHDWEPTFESY